MQSVGGIKTLTARDVHITYSTGETLPKQRTSSSIQWMNYSEKNIPDPILNEGEKGMFWKRMPESTYIYKKERTAQKALKDRLPLFLVPRVLNTYPPWPILLNAYRH